MKELERLRVKLDSVTRERDALSERAQQLANDLRILTNERDIAVRLAGATAPQLDAKIIEHNALVARVDEMALTQEKLQTKLAEAERAARLNLELLRDARRERDAFQAQLQLPQLRMPASNPADTDEGYADMHNGSRLYWRTEKHGGRVYASDEVGGGVDVWDTALVSHSTLCEAIAVEFGLLAAERRDAFKAKADEHRARSQASAEFCTDDGPDVSRFIAAGMAAQAAVDALKCPTCGALGCPVPCPNAERV